MQDREQLPQEFAAFIASFDLSLRAKGRKPKYRTITRKVSYVISTRDERLIPERAIPAAAKYLAGMAAKFGGSLAHAARTGRNFDRLGLQPRSLRAEDCSEWHAMPETD